MTANIHSLDYQLGFCDCGRSFDDESSFAEHHLCRSCDVRMQIGRSFGKERAAEQAESLAGKK